MRSFELIQRYKLAAINNVFWLFRNNKTINTTFLVKVQSQFNTFISTEPEEHLKVLTKAKGDCLVFILHNIDGYVHRYQLIVFARVKL